MAPKSLIYAASLALAYGGLATGYILVSSTIAADHSASVDELRRIETLKGVLYVAVTTLAVFAGGLLAMRRMERDAEELLRRERALLASQGRIFAGVMAASIAHDANNLLTAVLGDLDLLRTTAAARDHAALDQLQASIDRLVVLNRRLVSANRQEAPSEGRTTDLARVVRDGVAMIRSHKHLGQCRIVCRGETNVPCSTQPLLVHQIVGNLVLTAAEASGGKGTIEVVVTSDGRTAGIEVHDAGPGVPKERRHHLFDTLHSTKPHGSGLGLFSTRACVHSLGGSVAVGDSPLGGACFTVSIPLTPATTST